MTVLDALEATEQVAHPPHRTDLAAQQDDFQTVVMIDVHMRRADDRITVIMLHRDQPILQLALMVIVYERENTEAARPIVRRRRFDQPRTHEIAYRLRPVHLAAALDPLVEPL